MIFSPFTILQLHFDDSCIQQLLDAHEDAQLGVEPGESPLEIHRVGRADFAGQSRDLPAYSSMVQLFARLPDTYRAALEMKLVLGYSTAEIARRLGLTESAVNTRLSRGRALLRKIFEEEGIEP